MKRSKSLSTAALVTSLTLLGGLLLGGTAEAQKKGRNKGAANVTKTVNLPIPDRVAGGPWGSLRSVIVLGKKYKGLTVGHVGLTLQTTGSTADAAGDLLARITSPNGTTVELFGGLLGQNVGPLTLLDETRVGICNDPTPPCADPDDALGPPYFGKAHPVSSLSHLNGGRMKGGWMLSVFDTDATPTEVNSLGFWRLNVTAAPNPRKQV